MAHKILRPCLAAAILSTLAILFIWNTPHETKLLANTIKLAGLAYLASGLALIALEDIPFRAGATFTALCIMMARIFLEPTIGRIHSLHYLFFTGIFQNLPSLVVFPLLGGWLYYIVARYAYHSIRH